MKYEPKNISSRRMLNIEPEIFEVIVAMKAKYFDLLP